MDQYIGRLLDNRYEILEVIGTGGMAVVYKARCHRLNRLVAIKILKDEFSRDEEFIRRFHAEGEAVAMLSHPNIVQVFDVSSSDQANFIVMELIDGISLKQYMEKKGTLNWKETLHFAIQIGKGLEHAHSRGIVHRDIKPHNVMVLKNGSVKVMDFGIARVMNKSNTLTKEALGSVHYISPEQAKGGHTDNRSDIYSLSVVMYEMMTGRPPYDGESAVAVAIQHINGGAPMPSVYNPNIPGGLEQIIMKGMALDMKDRYVSATEMLQDMEEFRKNPAIVFAYKTLVDSATRPITGIAEALNQQPKTTAEKVVQARTGQPPKPRVPQESMRLRTQTPAQPRKNPDPGPAERKPKKRKPQEVQPTHEDRNQVATVAIVVCSAVAVVGLIIIMVAVLNGFALNTEKQYVEVPYLVGDMYSDRIVSQHSDFTIKHRPQQYSESYHEGQIMNQEPLGGSKVYKGTELWITVSMGEAPAIRTMEDMVGATKEEADSYLRSQDLIPFFKNEASSAYEAGQIIRTDPAYGAEVKEGQTVYLWVSTGPDIVLKKMPDVMGMDKDAARKVLDAAGFTEIRIRTVPSDKPQGTVVYQSEQNGLEIDVRTEILLEISEGPVKEPETTQEPTLPPETVPEYTLPPEYSQPDPAMVNVEFKLPKMEENFLLSIRQDGRSVIESTEIKAGTTKYMVALTNTGTKKYDVYINGEHYSSQEVIFTDD